MIWGYALRPSILGARKGGGGMTKRLVRMGGAHGNERNRFLSDAYYAYYTYEYAY